MNINEIASLEDQINKIDLDLFRDLIHVHGRQAVYSRKRNSLSNLINSTSLWSMHFETNPTLLMKVLKRPAGATKKILQFSLKRL